VRAQRKCGLSITGIHRPDASETIDRRERPFPYELRLEDLEAAKTVECALVERRECSFIWPKDRIRRW
jgi:hypothetical protein